MSVDCAPPTSSSSGSGSSSWSWSSVPKLSVSYFFRILQPQGKFSIVSRVVRSKDVDNVGEKVGKTVKGPPLGTISHMKNLQQKYT